MSQYAITGAGYRTRIVAALAAVAALLLAALLAPASAEAKRCKAAGANPGKTSTKNVERAILCLVNKRRAKRDLKSLKMHREPRRAAKRHTRQMVRSDCFAHQCPGEPGLVDRIKSTRYLPCNCYWGVGENIAWGQRWRGKPRSIVRAWMNSTPHRRNILKPDYRHLGVAVKWGAPVGGVDRAATVTADFGYKR